MYSSNTFVPRVWLLNSGKFIGQLIFYPDNGKPLPADTKVNNQINLFFRHSDFENVINLLETEKNVFLLFSGTGPGFENGILTASEPVGAGFEMKPAAVAA
jgi:hypothetical protein